ncbi:hypothetical protein GUITHDRAFT_52238, partial [Guillardia theta CCMP2712]
IGQGSYGVLFQGTYNGLEVAVEEPNDYQGLHDNPDKKTVYLKEVRMLVRTHHPNVCKLLGCILLDKGGDPFYARVTEFHHTLSHHLSTLPRSGSEKLDQHRFIIVAGLAEGLAYLHWRQVVHRDIHPHKISVTPSGAAQFADFRLSQEADALAMSTGATQLATMQQWTAPEKLRGEQLTAESDVYALGLVMSNVL